MSAQANIERTVLPVEWGVGGRIVRGERVGRPARRPAFSARRPDRRHGWAGARSEAAAAAGVAATALSAHPQDPVTVLMQRCHVAVQKTRGVVLSLVSIDAEASLMTWLGIGNVDVTLFRAGSTAQPERVSLAQRGGVVGYQIPSASATTYPIAYGDTLVFATDGIGRGFNSEIPARTASAGGRRAHREAVREGDGRCAGPGRPLCRDRVMRNALPSLQKEYAATLGRHLVRSEEAALLQAHELGRKALSGGFGVLDLVMLHHEAVEGLGGANGAPSLAHEKTERAVEFLVESLSPFEMSLRGYREANVLLSAMNQTLRHAKAATEAANHELEAFSYSVAHDLRAPLRSIDGFSQALLEDCGERLDDEGRLHLQYVREAAQEMAELIDGLLTLSRVVRSELRREPVDLADLSRAIFAQLQRTAPDRSVEIIVPEVVVVEGDARLLRTLLENLLGNAWKFTRTRRAARIEFGAVDSGPQSYFVRDNGVGFDQTYAVKLFGVFQRLHTAREFEGTGIGLATVQRIVTRHGGRVWAEGEVDRGATFHFTLWGGAEDRPMEQKTTLLNTPPARAGRS